MRFMIIAGHQGLEAGVMPEESSSPKWRRTRGAGEGRRPARWSGPHPTSKGWRIMYSGKKKP
jgi:hypothetical protein